MRRAASSLVSITAAISAYAASATNRSASAVRCLSGSRATFAQTPSVERDRRLGAVDRLGGGSGTGSGAPRPRADVVDHLAVGDRQQPAAQVRGVAQARIGAQRREPGLLVAVVGVDRTDARDQEAVDIASMRVEQCLERGQAHLR